MSAAGWLAYWIAWVLGSATVAGIACYRGNAVASLFWGVMLGGSIAGLISVLAFWR